MCEMHLECSRGGDCEKTCKPEKECHVECSGCKQACEAIKCHMTRTWPISSQDKLVYSGNGKCCRSLLASDNKLPIGRTIFQTCYDEERCACTKYVNNLYSTSNLGTSNVVSSTGIPLSGNKISSGQGTEDYAVSTISTFDTKYMKRLRVYQ